MKDMMSGKTYSTTELNECAVVPDRFRSVMTMDTEGALLAALCSCVAFDEPVSDGAPEYAVSFTRA
jgi:hypothetical protein